MTTNDPNQPSESSGLPSYGSTPPPSEGYPPPGGGHYQVPPQSNSKATVSLVLGIVGLVLCGIFTGIPAIILGKSAQREIDASNGQQTGRGMATAGFITGLIATILSVLGIIFYAILFATGAFDA